MSDIKPSQHVSQTFVCMLLAMLLATGCVLRLPPYEAQPIANYEHTQTKDGRVVAIHPIIDAHESETYFGMDLLGTRVLAVFVASENRAPSSSFILLKENISLQAGELKLQGTPDKARSDTTAEAIGWAGLARSSCRRRRRTPRVSSKAPSGTTIPWFLSSAAGSPR
jgi:hypothetical protein